MTDRDFVKKVAQDIASLGGKMYYVGGYVRDSMIGKENKDIDVEVYGITPEQLKNVLCKYGIVDEVGASFGILMIHGVDIDFAMPRKEKKTREGHKGFDVAVDPFMSTYDASKRRDFTMNSLLKEVLSGEIIDHFGGAEDIQNGVIRHIDDITFVEDPLRVFRSCQFASRFGFKIDQRTISLCEQIDLSELPKERIFEELKKALLKSDKPSIAFEAMRKMKVLDKIFPELLAMVNCPQPVMHHPEGDVWTHTMMVIDEASQLRNKSKDPLALMLSAVAHDLGKPVTTKIENGRINSLMHDKQGVDIAEKFLMKITNEKSLVKVVLNMVENHMRPNTIALVGTDKAVRKLMVDTDINEILLLSEADHKGRAIPEKEKDYSKTQKWFAEKIEKLSTKEGKIEPLVTGKDLIALGFKPGKSMGETLRKAFELQLEGLNKEEILKKVKEKE